MITNTFVFKAMYYAFSIVYIFIYLYLCMYLCVYINLFIYKNYAVSENNLRRQALKRFFS